MRKEDFLCELRESLSGLPQSELDERLAFYREQIDDRMEDGLSEEAAVSAIGSVNDIVLQVVDEYPFPELIKVRIRPKRKLSAGLVTLLVLGSPVWLSLLIALFAVILAVYVSLWAMLVSLWSVFVSLAVSAVGCLFGGVALVCGGYVSTGIVALAAALVCAGLSILAFFGCKGATKGVLRLTKTLVLSAKKRLIRKEEA